MKTYLVKFFLLFLILILAACHQTANVSQVNTIVKEPIIDGNPGPTKEIKRKTIEPVITFIPTSIITSTETPKTLISQTFAVTKSPTPLVTWTPRPTLPKAQAQAYALKMIKTNGGCQLPCWLGITPGKTTWDEANAYLTTFADSIDDSHFVKFKFQTASFLGHSVAGASIFLKPDGRIDRISTLVDLSLPELLAEYGPPTEIRLLAIGVYTIDPLGQFTLVLYYKEKGFMAVYEGKNERSIIIHVCPNRIYAEQRWLLWDPADQLTFAEAGRETLLISPIPPPSENDFIPIENLTDLNPESFYQRYKDPKSQGICMEMQAPDWP
jgi:hypothetical protein